MVVKKNFHSKKDSIYECDRCKKQLNVDFIHKIYVLDKKYANPTKKWDLCDSCFRSLCKGIQKGVTNGK